MMRLKQNYNWTSAYCRNRTWIPEVKGTYTLATVTSRPISENNDTSKMIASLPIYGDKIRITDLMECAVIDCNTTFTCVPSKILSKGKWLALAWNSLQDINRYNWLFPEQNVAAYRLFYTDIFTYYFASLIFRHSRQTITQSRH